MCLIIRHKHEKWKSELVGHFDIDVVFGVNSINFNFIKLFFKIVFYRNGIFYAQLFKTYSTEMISLYELFSSRQTNEKYI